MNQQNNKPKNLSSYVTGHTFPTFYYRHLIMLRAIHLFNVLTITRFWYVHWAIWKILRQLPKDFTFVEAGCGTSDYTIPPAHIYKDATIVGVDIAEDNIKMGKFYSLKKKLRNTVYILKGIEEFKSHKPADLISCIGVLHILPNDAEALQNMVDNLKPGGRLLLYVPIYQLSLWKITERLSNRFPHADYLQQHKVKYFYKPDEVKAKMKKAGLEIESFKYTYGKAGQFNNQLNRLIIIVSSIMPLYLLWILVPIWCIVQPILFWSSVIDVCTKNKSGSGMMIVGRKI